MCRAGSSHRAQSAEPHCAIMGATVGATVGAQEYALCRAIPPATRMTYGRTRGCATELVPCANGWVAPVFVSVVCACSHTTK